MDIETVLLGYVLIIQCIVNSPVTLIHCVEKKTKKNECEVFHGFLRSLLSRSHLRLSIITSRSLKCCRGLMIKVFSEYLH